KTWYPLCAAVVLTDVTTAGSLANLVPTFLYQYKHGKSPEVAHRLLAEAEMYGLKSVQLLLHIRNHRVPSLAGLKEAYITAPCTRFAGTESSMGVTTSRGLLFLLGLIFYRRGLPFHAGFWDARCPSQPPSPT